MQSHDGTRDQRTFPRGRQRLFLSWGILQPPAAVKNYSAARYYLARCPCRGRKGWANDVVLYHEDDNAAGHGVTDPAGQ